MGLECWKPTRAAPARARPGTGRDGHSRNLPELRRGGSAAQRQGSARNAARVRKTGWSPDAGSRRGLIGAGRGVQLRAGLSLEFGEKKLRPRAIVWFWWVVGLLALAAILVFMVR